MARLTIVSASVGAGHDGVARELARRFTDDGHQVSLVDFLDLLPGRMGQRLCGVYAWELDHAARTWDWVLRLLQGPRASALTMRLTARMAAQRTIRILTPEPDVVVSTYPLASQVLGALRADGRLAAPVVTYLTDMSVHRLWVASGVDLHLAVHAVPALQARGWGARVRVVTPAVARQFHPVGGAAERAAVRRRHGLPIDRPLALVVGGSWGVGELDATMAEIAGTGFITPVALCGNNIRLRDRLAAQPYGPALGWIDAMGPLLRACDVVVQNAGGLTSLQALACGVPVVSYRCVPGHGVTNAEGLDTAGYARWVRRPQDLAAALRQAMGSPAPALRAGADPAGIIAGLTRARGAEPVAA